MSNDKNGKKVALSTKGLTKYFGGLCAVDNVDMELYEGEVLALVGDNGAGKSTFIKMLTGIHQPNSGEIYIDNKEVNIKDRRHSKKLGIEAIYQDLGLIDSLPAYANVFLGIELDKSLGGSFIRYLDNNEMKKEAGKIMKEKVGVEPNPEQHVGNLSGGQQQAVALARAIYPKEIKVMIMDEPTAALGTEEVKNTLTIIRNISRQGIPVIVISHNLEHIFGVAGRIMVMRRGKNVAIKEKDKTSKREIVSLMIGAESEEVKDENITY